jgi:hypothetical protein
MGRAIRFETVDTCQQPPRADRTPWALSARAIPVRLVTLKPYDVADQRIFLPRLL